MREPKPEWTRALRHALLDFYDARRRDLPWRRSPDAYRVWVSEVMLQQTHVETVIPYYERWLRRFPNVETLAAADPDDVLKHWEGLGYYSRARNLQRAALLVRERHAGTVPAEPSALRALPGIGEYTAGAIASIAYGRREPAVDGNARRVLARLLDIARPTPARLRTIAAAVVPEVRPGDFNQSLMELGASFCSPRAPRCGRCPIAALCRAHERGTVHLRPTPRRRPRPLTVHLALAVFVAPGYLRLLLKRRERGLLGGLWCFPASPIGPPRAGVPEEAAARAAVLALARELVQQCDAPVPIGVFTHDFTHRREVYHAFLAEVPRAVPVERGRWVDAAALDDLAMPVAQRRIGQASADGRDAPGGEPAGRREKNVCHETSPLRAVNPPDVSPRQCLDGAARARR